MSTGKKILFGIIAALVIFAAGYLISYVRMHRFQIEAAVWKARVDALEFQTRLDSLTDQLGVILVDALNNNFGNARQLSTKFFDDVRQVAAAAKDTDLKGKLEELQKSRDEITTDLAQLNPAAKEKLQSLFVRLHEATNKYKEAIQRGVYVVRGTNQVAYY